jgi:UDP-N-acetylmuramate dehydrogenase
MESVSGTVAMATVAAGALAGVVRGRVAYGEPLSRHTSLRIGGPADALVVPADLEDLRALLRFAHGAGIGTLVLGGGSNTLVLDGGFRGVAILLGEAFAGLEAEGTAVRAGAAVRVSRLLAFCSRRGLSGVECLTGIPGTVGGALRGNAGTRDGWIAERLREAALVLRDGTMARRARGELAFAYRRAGFPAGAVITEATFELAPGDPAAIRRAISRLLVARNQTQPVEFRSAGCLFKNPPGDSAGRLVDDAGMKGARVGDAVVSTKHANFIINQGRARAADVLALADAVRARVRDHAGVTLELEVQVVGEP